MSQHSNTTTTAAVTFLFWQFIEKRISSVMCDCTQNSMCRMVMVWNNIQIDSIFPSTPNHMCHSIHMTIANRVDVCVCVCALKVKSFCAQVFVLNWRREETERLLVRDILIHVNAFHAIFAIHQMCVLVSISWVLSLFVHKFSINDFRCGSMLFVPC